jgi:hypothetical protein
VFLLKPYLEEGSVPLDVGHEAARPLDRGKHSSRCLPTPSLPFPETRPSRTRRINRIIRLTKRVQQRATLRSMS